VFRQTVVLLGWLLSLACLSSLVYGLLHNQLGIAVSAAYVGLGHTAWGVALGWIVIACCTGHGGESFPFFAPYSSSSITFSMHYRHVIILKGVIPCIIRSFPRFRPSWRNSDFNQLIFLKAKRKFCSQTKWNEVVTAACHQIALLRWGCYIIA